MERIADGVYQVSRLVNAFVVDGDEGVTLIDTGLPNRHGAIVEGLSDIGRSAKDVKAILITHGHVDHYGGAAALRSASDAEVFASHEDAAVVRGDRPSPPPPFLERVPFITPVMGLLPKAASLPVDHIVAEGFDESLPGDFTVIDTPGHTSGHVSYRLDRDGGILFIGDAATHSNGTVKRGFFNRSTDLINASIARLATIEFAIACFGHSAPLIGDASRAFAAF
jgi:glyoxylase-like metal-dependent hydrolase (beta-lactamase superfamily II)